MNGFPPVLYVDLMRSKLPRRQRWRWVAKSADNQRKLATSGEFYTNRQDCLDAIALVFAAISTVYLRQSEQGNQLVRMSTDNQKGNP